MSHNEEMQEQRRFEDEVRRVAEAIWSLDPGACQPEHYSDDPVIKELDGLARVRDVSHLIMVTVSRKYDKAENDVKKLNAAEKIEHKRGCTIKKWFITRDQLEAEHIKHCRDHNVEALSISAFKARFFDGRKYIAKRRVTAFGSARNTADNSVNIPEDEYIRLPITIIADNTGTLKETTDITFSHFLELLKAGNTLILMAPFGAGKSLTAKEVFLVAAKEFSKNTASRVPIVISLRDHWGSKYADEILERHAREIGFMPREDLVAAWRAGLALMILDGFDEVATQVIARSNDRNFMRSARYEALRSVRDLTGKVPSETGILITGRDHYFDNHRELIHSLGISGRPFKILQLGEFGEDEALLYLQRKQIHGKLPSWLPRKPLLLSYLASKNMLDQVLTIDGSQGFGFAWDEFLRKVTEREAGYAQTAMDARTLRNLLERISFDVRGTSSGTGPIAERDLADAYLAETRENPGEAVLMQLQRLPGLAVRGQEAGMRSFIDEDMLGALQGSALARFILEGQATWSRRGILEPLSRIAISMACYLLQRAGVSAGTVVATAKRVIISQQERSLDPQIAADCLEVAFRLAQDAEELDCQGICLESVYLGQLPLEGLTLRSLTLDRCLVDEVSFDSKGATSDILIRNCSIQHISGVAQEKALPETIFQECAIEEFDDLSTNAAIIRSSLHPRMKALLTVLKKLYDQPGSGRKLGAFKRGVPPGPIADAVEDVLHILASEGLALIEKGQAHPVRKHSSRVYTILSSAAASTDPLMQRTMEG